MPTPPTDSDKDRLLNAILPHVPFEGWSSKAFEAAVEVAGITPGAAQALCPRGAVDLASAYHRRGDGMLVAALKDSDLAGLRYSEKVATAIRLRLAAANDKEVVRRGTALFALPHLAPEGAGLIWGTADTIWDALGDTSDDINWYSKRVILSGVYAATVLYWLGDTSAGDALTTAFVDRRIDDVMRFEKVKAQVRDNKVLAPFVTGLDRLLRPIHAPRRTMPDDLPGHWSPAE
jgi:ubiquinone biosynthesis protein COQ9